MKVTWVIEPEVFPPSYAGLADAIRAAEHTLVRWRDDWWQSGRWPRLDGCVVVFHGSLGNAARVRDTLPWRPGAYCNTAAFHCSTWYPNARPWLLHRSWHVLAARDLVASPEAALTGIGGPNRFFVRPDSPLKPFAGRVLSRDRLSLRSLDHGFYYDDDTLPVVVAPVRAVRREWRYVVAAREVIAGSAYATEGRAALPDDPRGPPWQFASEVAARLSPPEDVYVMDICEADDDLFLLELNPFSGADLYACEPSAVVDAVSAAATSTLTRTDTPGA